MVLEYLKRCRHKGGQFVAFGESSDADTSGGIARMRKNKKLAWRKSNSVEIVRQMMENLDSTDTTAHTSSMLLLEADSDSDSVSSDDGESQAPRISEGTTIDPHPAWLKRPMWGDICGNHALVNAERQWANTNLHPLQRTRELDDLARVHAQDMAASAVVYHADPNKLCTKLKAMPKVRMGSNVAKGKELRDLHHEMKKQTSIYANMMDNRYEDFGIGTARDANGDLYLCQIFVG